MLSAPSDDWGPALSEVEGSKGEPIERRSRLRNYELVYIISPEVEEEDLEGVTERVGQLIADGGGEVLELSSWGRRRLAYPIQKFGDGHYILARIQLDPGALPELRRVLGLTEEVIRYLLIRTELG
jgi:small subunit ribosomal protein S6